jgi:amino acid adenylation domain-containing protein
MGDERITYEELETSSNQFAHLLREIDAQRGDRVCLFLPKSPSAIACMLATVKADCAYVPIDVASPAQRVEKIVRAADPSVIVATASTAALVDKIAGCFDDALRICSIDDTLIEGHSFQSVTSKRDWDAQSMEPLHYRNSTDDPAHLLFTSGSTGMPKGVVIKHSNVIAFIDWAVGYFGLSFSDRVSGHPPLHFDLSTFDIYGAQAAGAELHLIPASLNLIPHKLAELIRTSELTQWFSVPSTMTLMAKFDAIQDGDFAALRRVLWCGEVLPTPTLIHWMSRLRHVRFTNLYGPTEATIASSYYTVPEVPSSDTEPIPIGTACAGEELLVLDSKLRPVPADETGALYIAGAGLSPGYWRDDEKTRQAFVEYESGPSSTARIYRTGDLAVKRDDGLIYFLGREDTQIKSRGYRIELGEIESALSVIPQLRESAVVGLETGGFEGWAICCAYAAAEDSVSVPQVKEVLREALPQYMIPSRWLTLTELPKNANGKVDRRALRELFGEGRE